MNQYRSKKLKPLLDELPPGYLADSAWLVARKIDRKSIHDYVKRGWLEPVVYGLYRRPFVNGVSAAVRDDWKVTVLSMQRLMGYDVHVGGKTALSTHGFAHYLNLNNKDTVFLYGTDMPSWLKRLPSPHEFEVRSRKLFSDELIEIENSYRQVQSSPDRTGTRLEASDKWSLLISSPERAILELIDELPNKESFHIVDSIFEGLVNLRPAELNRLLKSCKKIKTKRLFFVLADKHLHGWSKYVDPADFDLGVGPRALVKGHVMHPRYRISVPENLMPQDNKESR